MAKKPKPDGPKYNYMDTYGDLVTLLLCFFVLLFSMSTVEEQKYNAFVAALSSRFGSVPTNLSFVTESSTDSGSDFGDAEMTGDIMDPDQVLPADFTQLLEAITSYTEEQGMQGEVDIEKSDSGATLIRLSNNMLFDGNSSNLKPEAVAFLDFISECFNSVQDQILQVKFNGHTASVSGSDVDDWILSNERAAKVDSYVVNTGGFNRFKIQTSGYGRNYPIADNETPEGRAKNRRVDIIAFSNESDNLALTLSDAMRVYFPGDDMEFFQGDAEDLPPTMVDGTFPTDIGEATAELTDEELAALAQQILANSAARAPASAAGGE